MEPQSNHTNRRLGFSAIVAFFVLLVVWIFGHYEPHLIANGKCFSLLGCNSSFFGYDALIHVLSSTFEAITIIWLMNKFKKINLFHENFWKNFVVVVSIVAVLVIAWEFAEFASDNLKMRIFNVDLISLNRLDQPSNTDTMGDMAFSLLGASLVAVALRSKMSK